MDFQNKPPHVGCYELEMESRAGIAPVSLVAVREHFCKPPPELLGQRDE